ncbi:hypothetical protein COCVIDRAFT_31232 [Bipolaris victoriae FI3]|uniref:Uncharacterized protein n=1 Tax=Bipolaris victoriae (strain FI3) TaxID=930091 RepID=W7E6N2_BIPV3|nr:hypothetical protein COCVIDRAFT_31232 [Bipolaris victoriae FI3]
MRSANNSYVTIHSYGQEETESTPWYWRLIALAASWMILGGYLLLPGLYAKDAQLRFTEAVLSVFVVALLTAGYSFTALLCFACRNKRFQAEGVSLPALASSALGLISIAYNFLSSRAYQWGTSATTGTVLSATTTLTYTVLCIHTFRRLNKPVLQQPDPAPTYGQNNPTTAILSQTCTQASFRRLRNPRLWYTLKTTASTSKWPFSYIN